jgi:hypothetical protein
MNLRKAVVGLGLILTLGGFGTIMYHTFFSVRSEYEQTQERVEVLDSLLSECKEKNNPQCSYFAKEHQIAAESIERMQPEYDSNRKKILGGLGILSAGLFLSLYGRRK